MTLIILIKQPVVEFFAGKHYFYHIVSEEVPLEIYFGGFRQCLSLCRRISTPRPITQKQKSVKVSSVKSAHGFQGKNSEKASTNESNCEGSCPAIIKSSTSTAAMAQLVKRSPCMREIAVRFPVASRAIIRYSVSSTARQQTLVQMTIKTKNITCHCWCGNLKISTAQWP